MLLPSIFFHRKLHSEALVIEKSAVKPAFHDADTDTDILADILARIVARISACRLARHRNNCRKSRVSDVSAKVLTRMLVSVSASWNAGFNKNISDADICRFLHAPAYCGEGRTITICVPMALVLTSQAEAIVRTRKTWPQATKRRTGD